MRSIVSQRDQWAHQMIEARDRLADQLDVDQLTKNVLNHYDMSSQENRIDGANWYPAAKDWVNWVSQRTGYSPVKAAAVVAALSPQRRFSLKTEPIAYQSGDPREENASNVGDAMRFFNHWAEHGNGDPNWLGHGTIGDNYQRVMRVHQAPNDPQSVLGAMRSVGNGVPPKVSNFLRALRGNRELGDQNATVIDTWMARGILGQNGQMVPREDAIKWLGYKGEKGGYTGSAYEKMAQAITNAARLRNVDPVTMQASVWSKLNDSHYNEPDRPTLSHPRELHPITPIQGPRPRRPGVVPQVQETLRQAALITAIPKRITPQWEGNAWNAIMRSPEGITFHDSPGDAPESGHMVGQSGYENSDIPFHLLMPSDVGDYARKHRKDINSDPENYYGGWQDEGKWYQDVPHRYENMWDAGVAGYGKRPEDAQHGIYHIDSGTTYSPLEVTYNGEPGWVMASREEG